MVFELLSLAEWQDVLTVQPTKLHVRIICNRVIHVEPINQIEKNIMGYFASLISLLAMQKHVLFKNNQLHKLRFIGE